jgi:hypothetical protein
MSWDLIFLQLQQLQSDLERMNQSAHEASVTNQSALIIEHLQRYSVRAVLLLLLSPLSRSLQVFFFFVSVVIGTA